MEVLIAEFEEVDPFAVVDGDENANTNKDNYNRDGSPSAYNDYEEAVSYNKRRDLDPVVSLTL